MAKRTTTTTTDTAAVQTDTAAVQTDTAPILTDVQLSTLGKLYTVPMSDEFDAIVQMYATLHNTTVANVLDAFYTVPGNTSLALAQLDVDGALAAVEYLRENWASALRDAIVAQLDVNPVRVFATNVYNAAVVGAPIPRKNGVALGGDKSTLRGTVNKVARPNASNNAVGSGNGNTAWQSHGTFQGKNATKYSGLTIVADGASLVVTSNTCRYKQQFDPNGTEKTCTIPLESGITQSYHMAIKWHIARMFHSSWRDHAKWADGFKGESRDVLVQGFCDLPIDVQLAKIGQCKLHGVAGARDVFGITHVAP